MTTTNPNNIEAGTKVQVVVPADHAFRTTRWFPTGEITGTVQRVFKNGNVAVAVDQLRNGSEDGCKTLHFDIAHLHAIGGAA